MKNQLRALHPGHVVLASFEHQDAFEDAVDAFAVGGTRSALMVSLMALGLTAAEIRWHAGFPGRRMRSVAGE
jgi:hypothetical protein